MKKTLPIAIAALFAISLAHAEKLKLENPGFEENLAGWKIIKVDGGKSGLSPEAARTGQLGMMVIDEDSAGGSEVFSEMLPASGGRNYKVHFWGRTLEGSGMGVYLVFYGSDRQMLKRGDVTSFTLPADDREWKEYTHEDRAPEGTEFVAVRIHSYGSATVRACLDDFELQERE